MKTFHRSIKHAVQAFSMAAILISCQKKVGSDKESITGPGVSSEANSVIKSHTITFKSDYPVKPGQVPPFAFTKTSYPDARIRSISMLSRAYPIYPGFPPHAVELTGNFTYSANNEYDKAWDPHLAILKGTSQVWEYYKTATGTGARRSVSKRDIFWRVKFNVYNRVVSIAEGPPPPPNEEWRNWVIMGFDYDENNPEILTHFYTNHASATSDGNKVTHYFPTTDQYGNILSFVVTKPDGMPTENPWYPAIKYDQPPSYYRATYDYSILRGSRNYSFIPSQNLISQEYSLMEVMQWLPQPTHQRKGVGGTFSINGKTVTQDQVYKNFQFDSNGNQVSVTYGDNVLQRTTWHVQP